MNAGRSVQHESLEPRLLLSGTTYVVDSLGDNLDTDGLVTLREAIEAANTNAPVGDAPAGSADATDVITFAPALTADGPASIVLATGNVTIEDTQQMLGPVGVQLTISDDLDIQGPGPDLLAIDAAQLGRVMVVESSAVVSISGVTITGGAGNTGWPYGSLDGIGIHNSGVLSLGNVAVTGNGIGLMAANQPSNDYYGGGIYNSADGVLHMIDSEVCSNANYIGGGIWSLGELELVRTSVSGNVAVKHSGGVYSRDGLVLIDSIVSMNQSLNADPSNFARGGGVVALGDIFVRGSEISGNADGGLQVNGSLLIESTVISNNYGGTAFLCTGDFSMTDTRITSNECMGGSALVADGEADGVSHISGCIISDNVAGTTEDWPSAKGAVRNKGVLVIEHTMISNNTTTAKVGGTIANTGDLTLINTQIAGNNVSIGYSVDSDTGGGGVFSTDEDAEMPVSLKMVNCTVAGNFVDGKGGGLYIKAGNTVIENSIIAGNFATDGSHAIAGEVSSGDHNIIGYSNGMSGLVDGVNGNQVAQPDERLDPMLAVDATDGQVLLVPMATSPALDAGSNALAGVAMPLDLAGNSRLSGASVDIGAVEGPAVITPTVTLTSPASGSLEGNKNTQVSWDVVVGPYADFSVYYQTIDGEIVYLAKHEQLVASANWSTANLPAGEYTLTVEVCESGALVASDSVTVNVTHDDRVVYVVDTLEYDHSFTRDGVLSISEALAAAEWGVPVGDAPAGSFSSIDLITFDPSLAGGTFDLGGLRHYISDDLEIRGLGADNLTLNARMSNRLLIVEPGTQLRISNIRLDSPWSMSYAGINIFGSIVMEQVTVDGSRSDSPAVYVASSGEFEAIECEFIHGASIRNEGSIVLVDSEFHNTSTYGGGEASVYGCTLEGGAFSASGNLILHDSEFSNGSRVKFDGGSFDIAGCTFENNGCVYSWDHDMEGAILIERANGSIRDCDIVGNAKGGLAAIDSTVHVANTLIWDYSFAGIWLEACDAVVEGCEVANDGQEYGAGMLFSDSTVLVNQCLITENYGPHLGGIIAYGANLTVANSTITNNIQRGACGIYSQSPILLFNSIVAGNSGDVRPALAPGSTNNIIGIGDGVVDNGVNNLIGTAENPIDAGLIVWTEDGRTRVALSPDSPAIDAGASELAVDATGNPLTTDLAGNPRFVGLAVDIGAVEFEYARGDADQDGDVDLDDFGVLKENFGIATAEWGEGDFNGDGRIDLNDFVLLKRNYVAQIEAAPSAPVEVQAEAVATETSATETAAPVWQEQAGTDRSSRLGGRSVLEAMRARRLGEDGPGVLAVRPLQLAI